MLSNFIDFIKSFFVDMLSDFIDFIKSFFVDKEKTDATKIHNKEKNNDGEDKKMMV